MAQHDVICVGAVMLDTIAVVDHVPGSDQRAIGERIVEAGGGPAATAAVALARLGIGVGFAGVVGEDDAGRRVRTQLESEGVDTAWLRVDPSVETGRSLILVERSTSGRTIIAGPAPEPEASDVPLGAAPWLHADHAGYLACVTALAAATGSAGTTGSGGTARPTHGRPLPRLSLDAGNPIGGLDLTHVDLYAPTRTALLQRYPDSSVEEALRAAGAEGPATVVATDGPGGSFILAPDSHSGVVHVPAFSTEIISTLGAGDVFHGALLAGLAGDHSPADALRRANATAALSCRAVDGRSAIPTDAELDRFLSQAPSASPPPATSIDHTDTSRIRP